MRKSILFVIDSLNCGGAEKSMLSLLPLLNREKYAISLWILHRGGILESLIPEGIHILGEPKLSSFNSLKLKVAYIVHSIYIRILRCLHIHQHGAESLWKTTGWARKGLNQTFDVAIAYQQGFPTYLVATKIKAKKKLAWVNADIFNVGYNIPFNIPFYEKYDHIVPVSNRLQEKMQKELPQFTGKYLCVYDILNPELIRKMSLESVADITKEEERTILVTVARMAPPKGYDIAVNAAHCLKEKGIHFIWYFIGDGSEKHKILEMIKDYHLQNQVRLLGLKTNPYPYMRLCDIYVQPSIFEGFGMTISEAKILGKPVVSTNFKVVYDQITQEKNGLISEMNGTSLGNQIIRLITDNVLKQTIINNVLAEENTTYKTEVVKIEQLFDED